MKRLALLLGLIASPVFAANELQLLAPEYTGLTTYSIVFDASGNAWNGSAFATFTATQADFDVAMTEVSGTGLFRGTMPGTAGSRSIYTYLQSGGSPAANDLLIQTDSGYWDGTLFGDAAIAAGVSAAVAAAEAAELAAENAGAGTKDTRDLDPVDHLWNLKRSGDGTWRSTNKLIVHPGDTWRAGWNCDVRAILPQGKVIASQGDPELVTATDDLTLADPAIGHDATVPKVEFEVAADAVAGETHWIKTEVTAQNASGPKVVYGEVYVQAEPE